MLPTAPSTMDLAELTEYELAQIGYSLGTKRLQVAIWLSLPTELRSPDTQTKLAEALGVHPVTVSNWTRHPEVVEACARLRSTWLQGGTASEVLGAMAAKATAGDVQAAKLVLEAAGLLHSTEQQGTTTVQIAFVQQNAAPNPLRRAEGSGLPENAGETPAEGVGGSDREPTK